MRQYEEVINQILEFARNDNSIRSVMLNGSRVNINAPVDIMQDYDIVFFVEQIENMSFKKDRSWINQLGQLIILQQNDFEDGSCIFLMQFSDIRIDLRICDINKARQVVMEDTLSMILLDKDNRLEILPPPSDAIHWVKKPSEVEWDRLLNELWWIQTYVAKGIWRDELPFVKYMYDVILMDCVRKLISWHIGIKYDWNINTGKCGKWFKRLLEHDLYLRYIALYAGVEYEDIWERLLKLGALIREVGTELGVKLGYKYSIQEDANVTAFLESIRNLPRQDRGVLIDK